ncbi:MAG TPA: sensor histidine kinase N-terminal domain-containing protein, partial [Steroidobacteraceae bacterium]
MLRLLLLPISAILVVSGVSAYYLALEPATEALDASLIDAGIAIRERIFVRDGLVTVDLPTAAEQVLRADRYDAVYYVVRDPGGNLIAGDSGIPLPPPGQQAQDNVMFYDAEFRGARVRGATLLAPCGKGPCAVTVAETTRKRDR